MNVQTVEADISNPSVELPGAGRVTTILPPAFIPSKLLNGVKFRVILVHLSPTLLHEDGRVVIDRLLKTFGVIVGKTLVNETVPDEIGELFGAAVVNDIVKIPVSG